VIEKDNRLSFLGMMFFLSLFLVIGFGVMSAVLRCFIFETYIFDKDASTLTLKKRGIGVNEVAERSLSEISQVKLETIYGENGVLYKVCLLMDEGDRLSLGGCSNQKEQQKIADWIHSYLDGRSV
jgi:E3 ubiquitin-protein ligase DOA10